MFRIKGISAMALAATVAACANPMPTANGGTSQMVCDTPISWEVKAPEPGTDPKYSNLVGLWKGEVQFDGRVASMCITAAIQDVKPDGKTNSIFVWNLGASAGESTNSVARGTTNWWAQIIVLFPDKGEQIIFSSDRTYNGLWYRYVLDFPKDDKTNTIRGYLNATNKGSATDTSQAEWSGAVATWPVTLHRATPVYYPIK